MSSAEEEVARLVATLSSLGQGDSVQFLAGTISLSNGYNGQAQSWLVTCGGQYVQATWSQGLSPYNGAPCVLALITQGKASTFHVMYIAGSAPKVEGVATVSAFSAGSATFSANYNGNTVTVWRASSYTPTVGDTVVLQTVAGQVYALAPLTVYTPPAPPAPPAPPPPPPSPTTGNSFIPAGDSGTYTAAYGSWNSYYGQDVFQGNGYVPMSSGSWFYNGGTQGLASKTTITAIRLWVPPRRQAGSYNSTLTMNVYTHNCSTRPAGEPSRIDGPFGISIPPYYGGGWANLPLSFAGTLKAGGGISIAGDPYMGFVGVGGNGSSGALSVDWSL